MGALPGVEVRRPFRLGDGVPAHPCRVKRGMGILCAGVVGEPNPACGPHAKKSLRPKPQKNRPRRGRPGLKEGLSRKYTSCFLKIAKIFVFLKTPTPGCGVTKVLRIYIVGGKRTSYELSPPKWYKEKGLFCRETNIGGSDRSGQREKPPRQTHPG